MRKTFALMPVLAATLALGAVTPAAARPPSRTPRHTAVGIVGAGFTINGEPTYAGRQVAGKKIEGLLFNTRMVQGIFDDANPETRGRWAYPDTGRWDPERNTREFLAAMPAWRRHGVLSFTINLQGGSPQGYSRAQPWDNSAFTADGDLKPDYLARLARILDFADQLGMVPIVGYFYFGQDQRLRDDAAVKRATREATRWLLARGYTNLLIEVANETNIKAYDRDSLKPPHISELIDLVRKTSNGKLLVGTSGGGGWVPTESIVRASDFLLLHGNGVDRPEGITKLIKDTRAVPGYRDMPVVINEDDHFDFDRPRNHMMAAVDEYVSWGYFDPGKSDYADGFQCPPVHWGLNTERKIAFAAAVARLTGQSARRQDRILTEALP